MSDERPDYRANPRVIALIDRLRNIVTAHGLKWYEPGVGSGYEWGDIEDVDISWVRAGCSLYFGLRPNDTDVHYLKVWGPNMHSQMSESVNPSDKYIVVLWKWLFPGAALKVVGGADGEG